jgi:hypothetical protein
LVNNIVQRISLLVFPIFTHHPSMPENSAKKEWSACSQNVYKRKRLHPGSAIYSLETTC